MSLDDANATPLAPGAKKDNYSIYRTPSGQVTTPSYFFSSSLNYGQNRLEVYVHVEHSLVLYLRKLGGCAVRRSQLGVHIFMIFY